MRRKDRVAGIWVNTQGLRITAAPDFHVVASSGRLSLMLDRDEDVPYRISPPLSVRALAVGQEVDDATAFTEALLRVRASREADRLDEGSVRIVDDTLFRADIRLPSNLIEGDHRPHLPGPRRPGDRQRPGTDLGPQGRAGTLAVPFGDGTAVPVRADVGSDRDGGRLARLGGIPRDPARLRAHVAV